MTADPLCPCREVGRRADFNVDTDLLQLRLHIFGLRLDSGPAVIDRQLEAGAVGTARIARLVEKGVRLVQIEVIGFDVRLVERRTGMDSSQRRSRGSQHDRLVHEVTVDGVGDGLPDLLVGGRTVGLRVEGKPRNRANGGIGNAVARRRHAAGLLEPVDVARVLLEAAEMRLAGLQRDGAGRAVLDDPHHDLVEIGPAIDEEVVIPLQNDVLVALEFDKLERTGTDNALGIGGVRLRILTIAIDMLRNDRQKLRRHRKEQRRMRLAQLDDRRVIVGCPDRLDGRKHRLERMVFLNRLDREGDIARGDRLAVMEFRALDEVERDSQPVCRGGPAFGKVGLRRPVFVIAKWRCEQLVSRLASGDSGLDGRVQVPRRVLNGPDQRASALGAIIGNCETGLQAQCNRQGG